MNFPKIGMPLFIAFAFSWTFAQEMQAATIEENYPHCIELATELIEFQRKLGEGEILSEQPEKIISMLLAGNYFSSAIPYIDSADRNSSNLVEKIKKAQIIASEVEQATQKLLEESKNGSGSYKHYANFISKCTNNFDGEVESQRQVIRKLETQVLEYRAKLSTTQKELIEAQKRVQTFEDRSVKMLSQTQSETALADKRVSQIEAQVGELLGTVKTTVDAEALLSFIVASSENVRSKILKQWIEETHSSATKLQKSCMNWMLKHGQLTSACTIPLSQIISE